MIKLNSDKGRETISDYITMTNGITYNHYVVDYLDTNPFRVSRNYKDEACNTIDVDYVGRVVIRVMH